MKEGRKKGVGMKMDTRKGRKHGQERKRNINDGRTGRPTDGQTE